MLVKRRAVLVAATVSCALAAAPAGAQAYSELNPGGVTKFSERVPVNVVFVGFDQGDAPWAAVRSQLSGNGAPIVRSRAFYGITERLGLDYSYDYRPHYTNRAWEDGFFSYLSSLAVPKPLTQFQVEYNNQAGVLDVTNNSWIDPTKVEKRLIDTAPPGVDTRAPTIFFINWYGRQDFRFHVYAKTGEPDPDTGYDFGELRDSRKIVAWGGTTPDDEETGLGGRGVRRVWFYDLSAGPESWGGNYDVDNPDIDGDAVADYRIPVAWEYGSYRPRAALPLDLGKVIRYVGLDLLFTSSPLYPPYYTADRLPGRVDLDVNTIEGWPGVNASETYIKRGLFRQEVAQLPAGFSLASDDQDLPFAGDFQRCYVEWIADTPCFKRYSDYDPFANLFLAGALNTSRFLDREPDYEAGLLNYAVGDPALDPGLLGYADDNRLDGTQSGIFSFVYPRAVEGGYGLTTTMIHEYGHHSSMSHPHDGYDPETKVDYEPTGEFFFAWLGDESNSMMSYIDVNWDFSQFDRDNSARHHAAGFALIANRIAADILRDRQRGRAAGDLEAADRELVAAQSALRGRDYGGMLAHSAAAYRHVRVGAARADVPVVIQQPSTWTVPPRGRNHGSRMKPSTIDLAGRVNRKRMLP
jgi:hypothetical protein